MGIIWTLGIFEFTSIQDLSVKLCTLDLQSYDPNVKTEWVRCVFKSSSHTAEYVGYAGEGIMEFICETMNIRSLILWS